jgi:beta-phosphoglucomutase
MRHFKAVIFDLDGVLVSTDDYHYHAWKKVADNLGIPFNESVNHRLRGVSRLESLDIILEASKRELTKEEKLSLSEEKNNYYKAYLKNLTPNDIDKKIVLTLQQLKDKGFKLAIGSSSKNAKLILELTNLTSYFDAISDGTNIEKSKPDPEVFLKAAEYIAEEPGKCLIVEDAVSGIVAGNKAGMKTVAIGYAKTSEYADYKIDSLEELLNIV